MEKTSVAGNIVVVVALLNSWSGLVDV